MASDHTPDSEKGKTFTALVRLHEANCGMQFLTDQEHNFRLAIMKAIAGELKLSELRDKEITGPGGARSKK